MPATSETVFLDTNILVYAYDPTDAGKQKIARDYVRAAILGNAFISSQIFAEFATTLLHKLSPPATPDSVSTVLDALAPIPTIAVDLDMVKRAVDARAKYRVHFFDGMVIAAAERARCARILSEDLNNGQDYFGIRVENPFK